MTRDFGRFTVSKPSNQANRQNIACVGCIEVVSALNGMDIATALAWIRKVLPKDEVEAVVRQFLKYATNHPEIDLVIEKFEKRQKLRLKEDLKQRPMLKYLSTGSEQPFGK